MRSEGGGLAGLSPFFSCAEALGVSRASHTGPSFVHPFCALLRIDSSKLRVPHVGSSVLRVWRPLDAYFGRTNEGGASNGRTNGRNALNGRVDGSDRRWSSLIGRVETGARWGGAERREAHLAAFHLFIQIACVEGSERVIWMNGWVAWARRARKRRRARGPRLPYSFKKSTAYWAASMEPRTSTDSSGS